MRKDREVDRTQSRRRHIAARLIGQLSSHRAARESGDGHVFAREEYSVWSYLEGKNG